MVSSVQPSSYAPLAPLPTNPRAAQTGNDNGAARDAVTISAIGDFGGVQDGVNDAQSATDLALGAGREGASLLSEIRDLAREAVGADDQTRAGLNVSFQNLLQRYGETIDGAVGAGADLLAGQALTVTLDPGAPPVTINGYDLRLKDDPGAEDALRLSSSSTIADPGSAAAAARDADSSLARVDTALSRLSGAAQRLNAHDHFLGALDAGAASQVSEPADAEGARLLALHVRQSLQGANAAIANSTPQALLALFRE